MESWSTFSGYTYQKKNDGKRTLASLGYRILCYICGEAIYTEAGERSLG